MMFIVCVCVRCELLLHGVMRENIHGVIDAANSEPEQNKFAAASVKSTIGLCCSHKSQATSSPRTHIISCRKWWKFRKNYCCILRAASALNKSVSMVAEQWKSVCLFFSIKFKQTYIYNHKTNGIYFYWLNYTEKLYSSNIIVCVVR